MVPIRSPISRPKITKYRPVVITEGRMVCTQIREKRSTSLVRMVSKVTQ